MFFLSWKCTYSCSFSGGNLDFKLQEWGQIKIQKIQRASNRTQKNSRTKLSSPKNPMPNFWALKISRKENKFGFWLNFNLRTVRPGYTGTTTNRDVVASSPSLSCPAPSLSCPAARAPCRACSQAKKILWSSPSLEVHPPPPLRDVPQL